jgi:hypothetical protein
MMNSRWVLLMDRLLGSEYDDNRVVDGWVVDGVANGRKRQNT